MTQQIWIAGRVARCCHDPTPRQPDESTWELGGIFTTREAAAALCTDCRCFIFPWQLDVPLPDCEGKLPGQETPNGTCHAAIVAASS